MALEPHLTSTKLCHDNALVGKNTSFSNKILNQSKQFDPI